MSCLCSHLQVASLEAQIEAEIAWAKILNQRLRPSITVTEEEIDWMAGVAIEGIQRATAG